jgi:hypothetical protein
MKRFILPILSLLAAGSMTSCFQSETIIRLNKDGSGTLTEETGFGAKAIEMLAQLAAFGGDAAKDPLAELVSEEKAKARAANLGEGVTFEKVEPTAKDGGKGGKVTYRFADINKLKIAPDEAAKSAIPQMPGQPAPETPKTEPILFKYEGGKLGIKIPQPKADDVPAGEAPPVHELGAEEEKQMKELFAGMRVSVKLIIEPGISATNATYVEENTITLVDMDFGKMTEKPGSLQKMATLGRGNPEKAMEEMMKFDGVKVESKPDVEVTLK